MRSTFLLIILISVVWVSWQNWGRIKTHIPESAKGPTAKVVEATKQFTTNIKSAVEELNNKREADKPKRVHLFMPLPEEDVKAVRKAGSEPPITEERLSDEEIRLAIVEPVNMLTDKEIIVTHQISYDSGKQARQSLEDLKKILKN